ncbi:2-C-methyl-D-erythritol 4-phosphate cytidylyltransferase [Olivibacter sitiensis]|uniref:2-C-methyl-D-erythritol 4-phosphate cytidylyltransferase n=1 Tax=Olivibacter sitiensis TaxID=376470 RepID=UPI00040E8A49|nr:2-C-methyl-D-erythritol 4-phosphate cytidylyltransferase [Olivibacter sitiensis]
MKRYAIIVGGGSGSRMGNDIPKQFLDLCGKPILMHTLEAFAKSTLQPEIILVLKKDSQAYWQELVAHHHFDIGHTLVDGGQSRYHSVKNALKAIQAKEKDLKEIVIAIHDGVRPLVSREIIVATYQKAEEVGAVVTAMPSKDSIREIIDEEGSNKAVDRSKFYLVQTPQAFLGDIVSLAYNLEYTPTFTDDASVVESFGHPIHILHGDAQNLKITFKEDLVIAEAILTLRNSKNT